VAKTAMNGIELLQDLARLERELQEKLDEARAAAEARVAAAQDAVRRILAEAETEIGRLADASRARIAAECADIAQASKEGAETEKRRIQEQAQPGIDSAVAFVLRKVLP